MGFEARKSCDSSFERSGSAAELELYGFLITLLMTELLAFKQNCENSNGHTPLKISF
jgi:hypothetical protein